MEQTRSTKPFSEAEFKEVFSKVPRVSVDLIIATPKGIVLALRSRPTWNNQWHFPGGTIFYKESVGDAITRVAHDEVGCSVNVIKLLDYLEYPSEEKERGFGSTVSLAFLCSTAETSFTVNEDASEVAVFETLPANLIAEQAAFLQKHWNEILAVKAGGADV